MTQNRIRFLGDIHGNTAKYAEFYRRSISENSHLIQVGDAGVGFGFENYPDGISPELMEFDDGMTRGFVRGNHDNPVGCFSVPGFIECGTIREYNGLKTMFIGGAWTIDQYRRKYEVTWWQDEQNSYSTLMKFLDLYTQYKPDLMVTHAAPLQVIPEMFRIHDANSATEKAFDAMFEIHQPAFWMFGHYHRSVSYRHRGTDFRCFDVDESSLVIV